MSAAVTEIKTGIDKLYSGKAAYVDIGPAYVGLSFAHAHSRGNAAAVAAKYNTLVSSTNQKSAASGTIDWLTLIESILAVILPLLSSSTVALASPTFAAVIAEGLDLLPTIIPTS